MKKSKWNIDLLDVLLTFLPSLLILVMTIIYFIQLEIHLNVLTFIISPLFIAYFVIRNAKKGTQTPWMDWLSIGQFSILFLIGFYSVCQFIQQFNFSPIVNAAIFLSLTAFILLFIVLIVAYWFIYKVNRVTLSKHLYKKQVQISYDVYKECYQLFQEVKNFISFSYKITSVPPQERAMQDKIKQKYHQLLAVQKNIFAKKQAQVDTCKFYLSRPLQKKIEQLFQLYQQLFTECPTLPEEIKRFEDELYRLQSELEDCFTRELGVDTFHREIQLAIRKTK